MSERETRHELGTSPEAPNPFTFTGSPEYLPEPGSETDPQTPGLDEEAARHRVEEALQDASDGEDGTVLKSPAEIAMHPPTRGGPMDLFTSELLAPAPTVQPFPQYLAEHPSDLTPNKLGYWDIYDAWSKAELFRQPGAIAAHYESLHHALKGHPEYGKLQSFLAELATTRSALQLALKRPDASGSEKAIFKEYRGASDPLIHEYIVEHWLSSVRGGYSTPAWVLDTLRRVATPKLNANSIMPQRKLVPIGKKARTQAIENIGRALKRRESPDGQIPRWRDEGISFMATTEWATKLGFDQDVTLNRSPLWRVVAKEVRKRSVDRRVHNGVASDSYDVDEAARKYLRDARIEDLKERASDVAATAGEVSTMTREHAVRFGGMAVRKGRAAGARVGKAYKRRRNAKPSNDEYRDTGEESEE